MYARPKGRPSGVLAPSTSVEVTRHSRRGVVRSWRSAAFASERRARHSIKRRRRSYPWARSWGLIAHTDSRCPCDPAPTAARMLGVHTRFPRSGICEGEDKGGGEVWDRKGSRQWATGSRNKGLANAAQMEFPPCATSTSSSRPRELATASRDPCRNGRDLRNSHGMDPGQPSLTLRLPG